MRELVFFLEEKSAKEMLIGIWPRLNINPSIQPRYIPFEGKQDLEKQIVPRLRGYLNASAKFIVMRDQDSAPDCRLIKNNLLQKCATTNRARDVLVRIACHELETFYLADLNAVECALGINNLAKRQRQSRFRAPDSIEKPSRELTKLTDSKYQKVSGSRLISKHLDVENTRSLSFKNLILGIKRLETELLQLPD